MGCRLRRCLPPWAEDDHRDEVAPTDAAFTASLIVIRRRFVLPGKVGDGDPRRRYKRIQERIADRRCYHAARRSARHTGSLRETRYDIARRVLCRWRQGSAPLSAALRGSALTDLSSMSTIGSVRPKPGQKSVFCGERSTVASSWIGRRSRVLPMNSFSRGMTVAVTPRENPDT